MISISGTRWACIAVAVFAAAGCRDREPAPAPAGSGNPSASGSGSATPVPAPDAVVVDDLPPVDPLPDDEHGSYTPRVALGDPLTWPRATSRQFGCMLEKAGQRDPTFHCTAPKPKQGDPCKDVTHYYAGPEFPAALLPRVGHRVRTVTLSWEHGALQNVILQFEPGVDQAAVEAMFQLPAAKARHENITGVSIQNCPAQCSLLLIGFDHMGAGDVECPK